MKQIVTSLLAASCLSLPLLAQAAEPQEAAESWLTLVDNGQYAASWEQAAPLFQQSINQTQWKQAITAVRNPLGKLESRTLVSATPANDLPGAPSGEYLILQYSSQFEHKAQASETVTPHKTTDGTWKVTGYYIQ